MPIYRRLPKRGFTNIFRKEYAPVNLGALQQAIEDGPHRRRPADHRGDAARRRPGAPAASSTASACWPRASSSRAVTITVAGASAAAVAAVEKAGGSVTTTVAKPARRLPRKADRRRPCVHRARRH